MPREQLPFEKTRYICDAPACPSSIVVERKGALQLPWREFQIDGWVGNFVACSDACETRLRRNPNRT